MNEETTLRDTKNSPKIDADSFENTTNHQQRSRKTTALSKSSSDQNDQTPANVGEMVNTDATDVRPRKTISISVVNKPTKTLSSKAKPLEQHQDELSSSHHQLPSFPQSSPAEHQAQAIAYQERHKSSLQAVPMQMSSSTYQHQQSIMTTGVEPITPNNLGHPPHLSYLYYSATGAVYPTSPAVTGWSPEFSVYHQNPYNPYSPTPRSANQPVLYKSHPIPHYNDAQYFFSTSASSVLNSVATVPVNTIYPSIWNTSSHQTPSNLQISNFSMPTDFSSKRIITFNETEEPSTKHQMAKKLTGEETTASNSTTARSSSSSRGSGDGYVSNFIYVPAANVPRDHDKNHNHFDKSQMEDKNTISTTKPTGGSNKIGNSKPKSLSNHKRQIDKSYSNQETKNHTPIMTTVTTGMEKKWSDVVGTGINEQSGQDGDNESGESSDSASPKNSVNISDRNSSLGKQHYKNENEHINGDYGSKYAQQHVSQTPFHLINYHGYSHHPENMLTSSQLLPEFSDLSLMDAYSRTNDHHLHHSYHPHHPFVPVYAQRYSIYGTNNNMSNFILNDRFYHLNQETYHLNHPYKHHRHHNYLHFANLINNNTYAHLLNKYNPPNFLFKGEAENTRKSRFFVIKSYSTEDILHSIKHGIWCSTKTGNAKLNQAFDSAVGDGGSVYLFFSVNSSRQFCGCAEMMSRVDFEAKSELWAQDKWQGKFDVKWIYVKNVPNSKLRHIILENNESKPVTHSRDAQEVPFDEGANVFSIIRSYKHDSTIFDEVSGEFLMKEGDVHFENTHQQTAVTTNVCENFEKKLNGDAKKIRSYKQSKSNKNNKNNNQVSQNQISHSKNNGVENEVSGVEKVEATQLA